MPRTTHPTSSGTSLLIDPYSKTIDQPWTREEIVDNLTIVRNPQECATLLHRGLSAYDRVLLYYSRNFENPEERLAELPESFVTDLLTKLRANHEKAFFVLGIWPVTEYRLLGNLLPDYRDVFVETTKSGNATFLGRVIRGECPIEVRRDIEQKRREELEKKKRAELGEVATIRGTEEPVERSLST